MFGFGKKHEIYADYASATPVGKEVYDAMRPYIEGEEFGNPASIHARGRKAKEALEEAREKIARLMQVKPDEIFFTSGGTEANNMAIQGVMQTFKKKPGIITTSIEHSSVLEPIRALESAGADVTYLPVSEGGRVSEKDLREAIAFGAGLPAGQAGFVSIAYANGEIGTIEKIRALGNIVKEFKEKQPVFFHTDASQAASYLKIFPNDLGVDLLTLDASKMYGPKGVGLLFVKRGTPLSPLMRGGGQERGLRPGTENLAGIVGFAKAFEICERIREKEWARLEKMRNSLKEKLLAEIPKASLSGAGNSPVEGLPHFLNICIPGVDAEFLSVKLDAAGIALSSASACRSISGSGSSYVIEALPGREGCGKSSLRVSLGRPTSERDIERIAETIIRLAKSPQ
jgi:cysteine desulfurase